MGRNSVRLVIAGLILGILNPNFDTDMTGTFSILFFLLEIIYDKREGILFEFH